MLHCPLLLSLLNVKKEKERKVGFKGCDWKCVEEGKLLNLSPSLLKDVLSGFFSDCRRKGRRMYSVPKNVGSPIFDIKFAIPTPDEITCQKLMDKFVTLVCSK